MDKDDEKKFLKNLFDFLDSDSGESLEELKEGLREEGIDFDTVNARLKVTLGKLNFLGGKK